MVTGFLKLEDYMGRYNLKKKVYGRKADGITNKKDAIIVDLGKLDTSTLYILSLGISKLVMHTDEEGKLIIREKLLQDQVYIRE